MHKRWTGLARALWVLLALNSSIVFVLTLGVTAQFLQIPSARIMQGLAEHGLSLQVYAGFFFLSTILLFLVYFVVSLLIFVRRPHDGFALFTAIFLLSFGVANNYPTFAEFMAFYNNPPLWYRVPYIISSLSSWSFLIAFLVLYPDGRFVPRWSWLLAVFGFVMTTAWIFFPNVLAPGRTPLGIFGAVSAMTVTAGCFYAQFWRYRHDASPLQRQQTKWFVFALAFFLASTFLYFLPPILSDPTPTPAQSISADVMNAFTGTLSNIVIPIAVAIAILRYRLWDIDILIRKTLTYAIVVALLAIIYFGSVILLQQAFASVTGQRSEVITVLSTLAIAALFVPLRNRVQELIDRRFYRKKYDAQQVLNDFAKTVRDETNLEKLTGRLMQVADETMQPKSVSVWLRAFHDKGQGSK